MLYQTYQFQDDFLAPLRRASRWALGFASPLAMPGRRSVGAALELISRFQLTHARPGFDIGSVRVGNRDVPVTEEVVLDLPFGNLLHFAKDVDTPQPRVLVAAPLSGHFATLLRGTIETLLRDHDVYVTDWINAREVPLEAGRFGVEDYVDYLIRFLEEIGPGAHILAVCQPCVQTLAAVAVMSEDRNPATPRSMTLMAGPIDVRESPTAVNELATSKPLDWFERTLIARVPHRFAGRGRRVYPGFVQLVGVPDHEHRPPPRGAPQALPPPREGRGRGGAQDQGLLRRVFRGARPDRGVLHRDDRSRSSSGPNWPPAPSPTAAARSTRARSATPRC